MIRTFILIIHLNGLNSVYGYQFIEKKNCDKIGKELSSIKKTWKYSCVARTRTFKK